MTPGDRRPRRRHEPRVEATETDDPRRRQRTAEDDDGDEAEDEAEGAVGLEHGRLLARGRGRTPRAAARATRLARRRRDSPKLAAHGRLAAGSARRQVRGGRVRRPVRAGRRPVRRIADPATRRQVAFSVALIALVGKMAKADGIVTADEVAAFRSIFTVPAGEEQNVTRLFDLARRTSPASRPTPRAIAALYADDREALADVSTASSPSPRPMAPCMRPSSPTSSAVAAIFGIEGRAFEQIAARHVVGPRRAILTPSSASSRDWPFDEIRAQLPEARRRKPSRPRHRARPAAGFHRHRQRPPRGDQPRLGADRAGAAGDHARPCDRAKPARKPSAVISPAASWVSAKASGIIVSAIIAISAPPATPA